jgi:hypothetical protein
LTSARRLFLMIVVGLLLQSRTAGFERRQCPWRVYSVEKLGSRGDPKILKPLQASARVRHEGPPGRYSRLLTTRPLVWTHVRLGSTLVRSLCRKITSRPIWSFSTQ